MLNERYELRYLPLFYKDLDHDISHIIHKLGNPDAARKLIDEVEAAIIRRLEDGPESFEQVSSRKNKNHPYYRIYIKNFVIYYVVLEDNGKKIMEVRRFLHKLEDRNSKV